MVTNYYHAGNRFSGPVRREPKPYVAPPQICDICGGVKMPESEEKSEKKDSLVHAENKEPVSSVSGHASCLEKRQEPDGDTLLLLGLVLLLLTSGCEDKWLLLALGYLLLF